ncbi:MAG: (E)-4-hydroxy-3-methylbut-2-enyl-diphosphate synthase [SAR324 cluster bacterium]|nr:(E)-4-hydroxy-3-methylbut-2-enyl-diphosphate synthase [SAR324 cluster bacterium]
MKPASSSRESSLPEYFPAPLAYRRRPTRVVRVGDVGIGGDQPIRVQSMLTANTWDVPRVIEEMGELAGAGCEIVRLTVPARRDLKALPEIRAAMAAEGLTMPLVADIHFNPKLAVGAAPHVEKVRINPGNYVDQKRFEVRDYSDAQYAEELARVEDALLPLIEALKRHGRSLRVGVNHGSLSDRVLNRHGDTPRGMVECAMEYLRILARHGFHENVVSMKSSNPLVAIRAYRLLAMAMDAEGMDYPLHLGVTEAGDGAEGRVKSAIGIGALLRDGLGDTVRVSLTESAAKEIPAARQLVRALGALREGQHLPEGVFHAPLEFRRRSSLPVEAPTVPSSVSSSVPSSVPSSAPSSVAEEKSPPVMVGGGHPVAFLARGPEKFRLKLEAHEHTEPFDGVLRELPTLEQLSDGRLSGGQGDAVLLEASEVDGPALRRLISAGTSAETSAGVSGGRPRLLILRGGRLLYPLRRLVGLLETAGLEWPLGVMVPEHSNGAEGGEAGLPLDIAAEVGSLAADGLLDAIVCPVAEPDAPVARFCRILLQGARLRAYRTEYISCPSCGRTLFDLEEITARIKARTAHLKGVRIGIMGCIVNGPGEMADADFGYVGGAPGRINLYKGQDCVERGIPAGQAVERLVELIKQHGAWVEAG